MFENPGMAIVLAAFFILVLGSGISVSFLLGRRSARAALRELEQQDRQLPEHVVREIVRCLELGDYVARDAETLTNIVAVQPGPVSRPVNTAMQQLINTAKSLVGRLNRMGAAARVARPLTAARGSSVPAMTDDTDDTATSPSPPSSPPIPPSSAKSTTPTEVASESPETGSADSRRFPRSTFRGTAWATIYPQHPTAGREPQRCEVMTRDLSCGGVGIAHSEPLFPKQIIVLDALGKLLVSEVRWCRRVDENFYVAGCRLVKASA